MKLLFVFVSALVLVAHGNITPSEEEDRVYQIKPEAVAGYAGKEAGSEAPQALVAEEAPGVGVFGAEEKPWVYKAAEPAAEEVPAPESGVYIPSVARVCTIGWCVNVCRRFGYLFAQCISLNTCWCHN